MRGHRQMPHLPEFLPPAALPREGKAHARRLPASDSGYSTGWTAPRPGRRNPSSRLCRSGLPQIQSRLSCKDRSSGPACRTMPEESPCWWQTAGSLPCGLSFPAQKPVLSTALTSALSVFRPVRTESSRRGHAGNPARSCSARQSLSGTPFLSGFRAFRSTSGSQRRPSDTPQVQAALPEHGIFQ